MAKLEYTVSMERANTHYFDVFLRIAFGQTGSSRRRSNEHLGVGANFAMTYVLLEKVS